jgi:hypothetical protein
MPSPDAPRWSALDCGFDVDEDLGDIGEVGIDFSFGLICESMGLTDR